MADSTKPTLPSPMADITKRSTHSVLRVWSRISNPPQLHVPVTASTNRCTRGFEVNLPAILAPALLPRDARAYQTRLAPQPLLSWAFPCASGLRPSARPALGLWFSGLHIFTPWWLLKNIFLAAQGCLPAGRKGEEELAASHLRTSPGIDLSQQKEPGIFLPN